MSPESLWTLSRFTVQGLSGEENETLNTVHGLGVEAYGLKFRLLRISSIEHTPNPTHANTRCMRFAFVIKSRYKSISLVCWVLWLSAFTLSFEDPLLGLWI